MRESSRDVSSLRGVTQTIQQGWRVISVAALVGLLLGFAVALATPRSYSAETVLYASSQLAGGDATNAYQGSLLSEQRIASYVQLVTGNQVAAEVASQLGNANVAPTEVESSVTATAIPDTVLMSIKAESADPDRASTIANATANVLVDLVKNIEQPVDPRQQPPVSLKVVEPATPPSSPSWPVWSVYLISGLLLGLIASVTYVYLKALLDTSVREPGELVAASGAPILGELASIQSGDASVGLVVSHEPASVGAEDFRKLRTNLQFVDVDKRSKALSFTSALPAEGKTTTVCNLAEALAEAGERVIVVEADLRRPRIAEVLGLSGDVGLTSVLTGKISLGQALQRYRSSGSPAGFQTLVAGAVPPNASELLASQAMRNLVDAMRSDYDYVLIDLPPLLPVTDAAAAATHCDGVIYLCKYGATTVPQVESAVSALHNVRVRVLGAVLTMSHRRSAETYSQYYGQSAQPNNSPTPAASRADEGDTDKLHLDGVSRPSPRPWR